MRGGWRATGFVKSSDRNVPFGKQDLQPERTFCSSRLTDDTLREKLLRERAATVGLFCRKRQMCARRLAGDRIREEFGPECPVRQTGPTAGKDFLFIPLDRRHAS